MNCLSCEWHKEIGPHHGCFFQSVYRKWISKLEIQKDCPRWEEKKGENQCYNQQPLFDSKE